MITFLKGKVISFTEKTITLDLGIVGVEIYIPSSWNSKIQIEKEYKIYISMFFRNDTFEFYGFPTNLELKLFSFLIQAPGIGPKVGVNIISQISTSRIIEAIQTNKPEIFTTISGIGKKTAEKLVLELNDKILKHPDFIASKTEQLTSVDNLDNIKSNRYEDDLVSALINLGFIEKNVRLVVKEQMKVELSFSNNFTNCLKVLGHH